MYVFVLDRISVHRKDYAGYHNKAFYGLYY